MDIHLASHSSRLRHPRHHQEAQEARQGKGSDPKSLSRGKHSLNFIKRWIIIPLFCCSRISEYVPVTRIRTDHCRYSSRTSKKTTQYLNNTFRIYGVTLKFMTNVFLSHYGNYIIGPDFGLIEYKSILPQQFQSKWSEGSYYVMLFEKKDAVAGCGAAVLIPVAGGAWTERQLTDNDEVEWSEGWLSALYLYCHSHRHTILVKPVLRSINCLGLWFNTNIYITSVLCFKQISLAAIKLDIHLKASIILYTKENNVEKGQHVPLIYMNRVLF